MIFRKALFKYSQDKILLSGGSYTELKIECDALTKGDYEGLAYLIDKKVKFYKVVGVPHGGIKIEKALQKYITKGGALLIVDDVLTTGASMEKMKKKYPDDIVIGVVLFARNECPKWIQPICRIYI